MNAPTSEWLNEAIDQAWKSLNAPQNETVTSKWYFKQGYLYGQASRNIRLPDAQTSFDEWCRIRNELGYRSDNYKHAVFYEWFKEQVIAMNKGDQDE